MSGGGFDGTRFRLPDVGEGLDRAEIIEWLVAPGDEVARDQPLVEILTDKSQTQLPAPVAGVIDSLGFAEGDIAEVGQILVTYVDGNDAEAAATTALPPPAAASVPAVVPATVAASPRSAGTNRPKASPAVRQRAREADVDLTTVSGSGPGGRITMADLEGHRSSAAVPIGPVSIPDASGGPTSRSTPTEGLGVMPVGDHPLRGIRRVTAEAMTTSWSIPHIHGADELDAGALLETRRLIRDRNPAAATLTPLAFFVMAVAGALRRYPTMNASITLADGDQPGRIRIHESVNIGIAVAGPSGLVVPVIPDADRRSLLELADIIATLAGAARTGSVTAEQLRGGTFTISNYGSLGGRYATPIIRAPEVGIVGFGSIRDRPFAVDGEVRARPTLPISVAADHRLIDGDVMTAFQEHVIATLTHPAALLAP